MTCDQVSSKVYRDVWDVTGKSNSDLITEREYKKNSTQQVSAKNILSTCFGKITAQQVLAEKSWNQMSSSESYA